MIDSATNQIGEPDAQPSVEPKKRNCGRTGATSPEGRARSAMNALRHGSRAKTLILEAESEEGWQLLLNRWLNEYKPDEDGLAYDFVLKTAQAEWHRIRCQRNYDNYLTYELKELSPANWSAEQIKRHDLCLRYLTTAQRDFQRQYRQLQEHFKTREPKKANPKTANEEPIEEVSRVYTPDPESPTGFTLLDEYPPTPGLPCPRPFSPPPGESGGT